MRCIWRKYLAAVLGDQHHILNVEPIHPVNVAGNLHGQHHTSLQRQGLCGVDVGNFRGSRPQADGMTLVASALAGEHFLYIVISRMIELVDGKPWLCRGNHTPLALVEPILQF